MFRFLVLMIAAFSLAAAPMSAEARAKKPAAAPASHKTTKKGSSKTEASAKAHGKHGAHAKSSDGDDEDGKPAGCAPAKPAKSRHGRAAKRASCASSGSHKKGHAEDASDTSDEGGSSDCKPVRSRHGRHGKTTSSCKSEGGHGGRKVRCAPVKHARGKHAKRKCVAVEPPLPPPVFVAPRPPVFSSAPPSAPMPSEPQPYSAPASDPAPVPSSPASAPLSVSVLHPKPGIGIEVRSNPPGLDLWGARRRAERTSHAAAAAKLTLAALMGRSEAELRISLGEPELRRTEGDGALYTYRLPNCALLVFLHRADATGFKVTGAQAGPLERGGAAPDVDVCLKSAAPYAPAPK